MRCDGSIALESPICSLVPWQATTGGIPRTTHDLDFGVQLPLQSIPSLLHEFRDDFYLDEPAVRAALAPCRAGCSGN